MCVMRCDLCVEPPFMIFLLVIRACFFTTLFSVFLSYSLRVGLLDMLPENPARVSWSVWVCVFQGYSAGLF